MRTVYRVRSVRADGASVWRTRRGLWVALPAAGRQHRWRWAAVLSAALAQHGAVEPFERY